MYESHLDGKMSSGKFYENDFKFSNTYFQKSKIRKLECPSLCKIGVLGHFSFLYISTFEKLKILILGNRFWAKNHIPEA